MRFEGSTIFVTGGAGFIGSALVRHLLSDTAAFVVNIDKLTYASDLESIQAVGHPRYAFAEVDICNGPALRALFHRYKPDAVMNLAAESHVDRSIDSPGEFMQTNVVGTFTLLQEALRYWGELETDRAASFRFLHVSTDEVYGSLGAGACSPNRRRMHKLAILGSKASSDHLVRAGERPINCRRS
jgi:dTDP-glucose 4,6-dehydratase